MISNSGHDERGKYSGGQAGDQTGTEWQLINWYNRPWDTVFHYPDVRVRQLIAELAIEAAEALAGKIPFFEVNTGAISRGYRTTPYPAPFLLKELHRLGYGAVISSDCHDKRALDCWYPEAAGLLLAHGFREIYVLTAPGRFEPVSIG